MTKKTTPQKNSGQAGKKVGVGVALGAAAVAAAAVGYFLFGPKGNSNRRKIRAWTLKAKGEMLEQMEKAKDMSEEKYHAIVDKVIAKYAKVKDITKEEVADLEKEAKKYWKSIEKDVAPKVKKAKKVVKAAKTAAK